MECGLHAGWPLVFAVSLALAACKQQSPTPVERPSTPALTGSVSISGGDELAQVLPEAWQALQDACRQLETTLGDMQDFEFTVQDGQLYMLQTRHGKRTPQAAARIALDMLDEGLIDADEARREWLARQRGVLELTHNHGTESQDGPVYHDGNSDPRGFGHICVSVPDVQAACARFEALGVPFQKRLSDGSMKSLAFIKDPDGYWVEIIQPTAL